MKRLLVSFVLVSAFLWAGVANATIYRIERGVIKNIDPDNVDGYWTLVSNGGAENGFLSPWYNTVTWKGYTTVSTEKPFEGDYSFKSIATYNNSTGYGFASNVALSLNAGRYVVSAFVYFDGVSAVGKTYLDFNDVWLYDENGNWVHDDAILADPTTPGWQFIYGVFYFSTPIDLTLRFVRDGYFRSGTVVYFDDVSITKQEDYRAPHENTVVPEPMSLFLFGIGSIGMFFRRKKSN